MREKLDALVGLFTTVDSFSMANPYSYRDRRDRHQIIRTIVEKSHVDVSISGKMKVQDALDLRDYLVAKGICSMGMIEHE